MVDEKGPWDSEPEEINDFDNQYAFEFSERATRKAVVFSLFVGVLGLILYSSGIIQDSRFREEILIFKK